jgi:antitoxin ParD1/3/4
MTTLTISLPDSLKDFIEREVETKGYGNVSEYVRGLLREAQAQETRTRLEALLLEGLAKGKDIPLSPKFWSALRRDAAKIVPRRGLRGRVRRDSRRAVR